jgi:ribonuclease BN (tRNA processing enzyme)
MTCNVIATGSKGNAVQLGGFLLLDCGVPFKALCGCHKDLKLVLLTHLHSDHVNRITVKKLASERPLLRFGCCEWMVGALVTLGVSRSRIDVYETGKWYQYRAIKVSPVELFHDVPNCGYRVEVDGEATSITRWKG